VPEDSRPVDEVVLIIVLTVPSLDLVPRVSRRCESGLREALLSCRSCMYVELRYWYDAMVCMCAGWSAVLRQDVCEWNVDKPPRSGGAALPASSLQAVC
jgi:hypothetical protein